MFLLHKSQKCCPAEAVMRRLCIQTLDAGAEQLRQAGQTPTVGQRGRRVSYLAPSKQELSGQKGKINSVVPIFNALVAMLYVAKTL